MTQVLRPNDAICNLPAILVKFNKIFESIGKKCHIVKLHSSTTTNSNLSGRSLIYIILVIVARASIEEVEITEND